MRMIIRKQEEKGGCFLCFAVKSSFCEALPEPYKGECNSLVEEIARGSEEAVKSFMSIKEKVPPEAFGTAVERLKQFLEAKQKESAGS